MLPVCYVRYHHHCHHHDKYYHILIFNGQIMMLVLIVENHKYMINFRYLFGDNTASFSFCQHITFRF